MIPFTEISSANFACSIADKFLPGVAIQRGFHKFRGRNVVDQRDFPSLNVSGKYDFGGDVGVCKIDVLVPEPGVAWLNYPPIVVANESWLSPVFPEQEQSYTNWHRYSDGEICWIMPVAWIELCKSITDSAGVDHVIMQMLKDVDFVLSCHAVAYCHRLRKWSRLWPSAPHGYQN